MTGHTAIIGAPLGYYGLYNSSSIGPRRDTISEADADIAYAENCRNETCPFSGAQAAMAGSPRTHPPDRRP